MVKYFVANIVIVVYLLYSGFVLMELWMWFVVPFGVPAITIAWSVGLLLVFSLLKGITSYPKETDNKAILIQLFCHLQSIILLDCLCTVIGCSMTCKTKKKTQIKQGLIGIHHPLIKLEIARRVKLWIELTRKKK